MCCPGDDGAFASTLRDAIGESCQATAPESLEDDDDGESDGSDRSPFGYDATFNPESGFYRATNVGSTAYELFSEETGLRAPASRGRDGFRELSTGETKDTRHRRIS